MNEPVRLGAERAAVLWGLFFLICFGLGYPTLNRYDARKLGPDWMGYYDTVIHQDVPDDFPFNERVVIPAVARPFYLLARGHVGTWDPVWFGLLMANCLFAATATYLLLRIGLRVTGELPLALLACTLYLLNYVVPNLWLSGMVDSAEACLMLTVTWALMTERWWLLPLIGVVGGMAKQSFLPFATTFAGTWWLVDEWPKRRYGRLAWVAALGVTTAAALMTVEHVVTRQPVAAPWTIAHEWNAGGNYFVNLWHSVRDQQFWYAFMWLLPLGVWRLGKLPRPWVAASLAAAAVAMALAGYADLLGTVNRPLFTVIGPVLTLSTALLLAERTGPGQAARR
ncbi:MAG TPA: hypothetical protein VG893_14310 [Terracidiphilus sp.]|nr:hypothetical protein [Terracidiphilus sp.]